MYCPRCQINTEDSFCENCGGTTVEINNGTSTEELKENNSLKEKFEKENFKVSIPKFSKKKIASLIIGATVLVGGVLGYSSIQGNNTPKSTVEKYFNYLADGNYSNAYELLSGTDDKFLSEDMFKKSVEKMDFKGFKIEEFSPEQYKMVFYDPRNPSNFDISNSSNVFSVNVGLKSYPINIVKDGKKLLFFNDYKVDISGLTTKWVVTAPNGATVKIDGVEPNKSNEPNISNVVSFNEYYKPIREGFDIPQIFSGGFNINATIEGGEEVNLSGVQSGTKTDIKFQPNETLIKELGDTSRKFLELYYSHSTEDKYSEIVAKDSGVLEKIKQLGSFKSDKLVSTVKSIEVTEKSLDDTDHATIKIKGSVDYEDSSLVEFGMKKLTGTKDLTTEFKFKKDNGKWVIVETGYID